MDITKQTLEEIVNKSETYADICRLLNLVPSGDNYRIVKELLKKFDISFTTKNTPWNKGISYRQNKYSYEELIHGNPQYKNTNSLKLRLIKENIKENKCEICGISGNSVSLELHHIDGDHSNNKLSNLQILCPNCHSKTPNYRGKNKTKTGDNRMYRHLKPSEYILSESEIKERRIQKLQYKRKYTAQKYRELHPNAKEYIPRNSQNTISNKKQKCQYCGKIFYSRVIQKYCSQECAHDYLSKRPSLLQLINDFKELKSFVQVGKKYNVTDNAVRKWCRLYKIPDHTKDIKEYIKKFK